MFDILPDAEALPRESELLLDSLEGGDNPLWVVGTVEVPGIKAREVLEGSEELVAADYRRGGGLIREDGRPAAEHGLTGCCDEAEVMGYRRVVDEGVGNHGGD